MRCRSPDVARRRAQWTKYRERIDPSRLVFIDETWTKTNMAPLRGWAPRGQRIKAKVPHGRWQTMTFLAALRHDRITAPWFIDGPINGETFRLYVENVLVPLSHMEQALRGHYPEFGKMATYRIDGLGPLTHREIADTKHNGRSLLLFALHRYEPHRRPLRRFADRLRVSRIVLLPLNERLDIARGNQPDAMPQPYAISRAQ